MWIICAGAMRSGSTLQYNIVSKIVEQTGVGKRVKFEKPEDFRPEDFEQENDEFKYKVFKSHELTPQIEELVNEGNAKVIYSYRDIRDVVTSMLGKKWISDDLVSISKFTKLYLNQFEKWNKYFNEAYVSRYEDFYNDISGEVKRISKFLDIKLTENEIESISESLSAENIKLEKSNDIRIYGNKHFDDKTLLHSNHIQKINPSQFVDALTDRQVLEIERIAYKWLMQNEFELYWPKTNLFLSHSQHGDDFVAWNILGRKRIGRVIEIGAFDGVHLSNSLSFESLGWKSVCVEPSPRMFNFLLKYRKNSINYNCAIVDNNQYQEITFFEEQIGVLSGLSYDEQDLKLRYDKRGISYEKPKEIKVKANTLAKIIEDINWSNEEIDVVSIDVEGHELGVLKSIDFSKVCPKLFIIEANSNEESESILQFFNSLKQSEYKLIGVNRQNLFIVKSELYKYAIETLNSIKLEDIRFAEQYHPIKLELSIQSVKPTILDAVKSKNWFTRFLERIKFQ